VAQEGSCSPPAAEEPSAARAARKVPAWLVPILLQRVAPLRCSHCFAAGTSRPEI